MEINKQLFEDVLSGKLKGMFVLRNGTKLDSSLLKRNEHFIERLSERPYGFEHDNACTYYDNDLSYIMGAREFDIIDFIPETNMKEKELTNGIKKIDFDLDIAKKILSNEIRGEITNNGSYPIHILDINENEDYPLIAAVKGRYGWNIIKYNKKGVPQGWDGCKQTLHLKIQLKI